LAAAARLFSLYSSYLPVVQSATYNTLWPEMHVRWPLN